MSYTSSFLAIDVETTGFGRNARVLEIAAVAFENGLPVREYSQLLCPEGVDWNDSRVQEALLVNHLTYADLEGKPTFAQILPDLMVALAHPVWVAHNFSFDFLQVQQEFARAGRSLEAPPLTICTRRLAAYLSHEIKGNKLHEVAARYGVAQEGAHRAAVDARVCGYILYSMQKQGVLPADDAGIRELSRSADHSWRLRR
jgi:DNA polymerase III epsilon subunit-like protein